MSTVAWVAAAAAAAGVGLAFGPAGGRSSSAPAWGATPTGPGSAGRRAARRRRIDGRSGAIRRGRRRSIVAVFGLVLATALVAGLLAAVVVGAAIVVGRVWLARRARRRRALLLASAVPELIDLFAIAASAGHPVRTCLDLVAGRAPPEVRPVLESARADVLRGTPLAAALVEAGERLGPAGAALTDALVSGLATGAPLGPALGRASDAARDARRRQAEEAARRLPVTLLFPLVCCVLPAFGLLAVVPLLAASLSSLRS